MENTMVEPVMVSLKKSETDMFGNSVPAPEVPKIEANPRADRMDALSTEHKQIYKNLTSKQKTNTLMPAEKTHLKIFNGYLNGQHSHEQLKGYIGYKQNEHHLPLFGNAPEVSEVNAPAKTPTPDVPKIDVEPKATPEEKPAPEVPDIPAPDGTASMFGEPDKPQFPHAVFKELSDAHDNANSEFSRKRAAEELAYKYAGDHNSDLRQEIMQAHTGKKTPKSQARMSHVREVFEDWISKNKMGKSQMSMFGDPKIEDVKADTPKVAEVKPKVSEDFIKPEHELASSNGKWIVKGDPTATAKMHGWIKDQYKNKNIYTYGGLMASGHPVADKIKELHGNNKGEIFDHFNKITGRESGKESGVGENQLRMSMKDSAGIGLGDAHFKVPDLSREAKIERDSYPNGSELHSALNNREVSDELHKWHKDYEFNDFHKHKVTGEPYRRSLFNPKTDDFGKDKSKPGANLNPEQLSRYNELNEKHKGIEFTDEHKQRIQDLTDKENRTHHLSEKFEPADKQNYDLIQKDKERFTTLLQNPKLTTKEKEEHQEVLKDLTSQESELLNTYREKLGLHKGDDTGEKGFSFTEPLNDKEYAELEDLNSRHEHKKLSDIYNQAPEESHITKLLKHPMSSNLKVFNEPKEENAEIDFDAAPEKAEKKKPTVEPVKKDKKVKAAPPMDPQEKLESHFPTVGIETPTSLNKTLRQYGHTPESSEKEYNPKDLVDFNGSKYSIDKDGGTYVLARDIKTGKQKTLDKGDLEHFPTDKKVPEINKQTVQNFMEQHGEQASLEDIYSKMGFPEDAKGKDHIKKRLRAALLQLEHHHESGGYHEPIINRSVGEPHPKEKDAKEKGILYGIAKSFMDFAAQTIGYIKSSNLIKSLMIELYKKEETIYEKSLANKDIFQTLEEVSEQEKGLIRTLETIQAFTLKKSGIPWTKSLNHLLDENTENLCKSSIRFDLLKSMDNGTFQKALDAAKQYAEEEERHATYQFINPKTTT